MYALRTHPKNVSSWTSQQCFKEEEKQKQGCFVKEEMRQIYVDRAGLLDPSWDIFHDF